MEGEKSEQNLENDFLGQDIEILRQDRENLVKYIEYTNLLLERKGDELTEAVEQKLEGKTFEILQAEVQQIKMHLDDLKNNLLVIQSVINKIGK